MRILFGNCGEFTSVWISFACLTASVGTNLSTVAIVTAHNLTLTNNNQDREDSDLSTMTSLASVSAKDKGTITIAQRPKRTTTIKRYNSYNIFFMLERQLLLHIRGGEFDSHKATDGKENHHVPLDISSLPYDVRRYMDLDLPPLCERYMDLSLSPLNWFVELLARRDEKRVHRKSHGLVPFAELSRIVARNHKDIDNKTRDFVNEVAARLASHCDLLEAAEQKKAKAELKDGLERKEENVREGGAIIVCDSKSNADVIAAKVRFPKRPLFHFDWIMSQPSYIPQKNFR